MRAVFARPKVGGKATPPFANRLPARWCLSRSITIMRAKQILADDAMFLKASLHGVKKKAGGVGGSPPPPICTHDVFITGSERGHMGSVFAGRMILEVLLHSLSKRGAWGRRSPHNLQTDCLHGGTISKRPRNGCQRPRGPRDQRTRDHGTRGTRDQRTKRPGTWPNLLNPNVGRTF